MEYFFDLKDWSSNANFIPKNFVQKISYMKILMRGRIRYFSTLTSIKPFKKYEI